MATDLNREILLQVAAGRVPSEEVDGSPELVEELRQALSYLREIERFGIALSSGDLSVQLHARGDLAGAMKGLHAGLRHLTWQTKQVAEGDLSQHVDFMGEFSVAFNTMVDRLRESRSELCKRNEELQKANAELKATQLQLLQKEKMASVGQLAAGIAHEINTPLGFIICNLGSLQRYVSRMEEFIKAQESALNELARAEAPANTMEKISEIKKKLKLDFIMQDIGGVIGESLDGASRVKGIVDNLRGFARLDETENKEVLISECIESALNLLRGTVDERVTLVRGYESIPAVLCNPALLNQAFMGILLNAYQAVSDGGVITVASHADEERVYGVVSDNGCGITADMAGRVFEPFFTTREVGKGSGLGLSVAYNIVRKHDGEITFESEAGRGTTVTVSIPRNSRAASG
ncbi:MAG TPA: ATP-binding protein [Geobacteraceae bacterium]